MLILTGGGAVGFPQKPVSSRRLSGWTTPSPATRQASLTPCLASRLAWSIAAPNSLMMETAGPLGAAMDHTRRLAGHVVREAWRVVGEGVVRPERRLLLLG